VSLNRVWMPCPNYSSRGGSAVRLLVLHSTEGALTYQNLSSYFNGTAGGSNPVSSHVGIDDTPGTVGEYVRRTNKAWTQGNANGVAVGAELCAPNGASAKWTAADWNSHPQMLANTAQWLAEEAAALSIPLVRLTPAQAQGSGRGVCAHVDLGAMGGGHVDCGPGFPIDQIIAQAAGTAPPGPTPPTPTPTPTTGDDNLICVDPVTGGTWCVASKEGAVYTLGGAPYLGGCNNTAYNAARYPCVGIGLRPNNDGYRLCLDWGAGKGDQSADGTGPRFRTYDYPRNGSALKTITGTY
jgi:N-acetylmuramoyl-L-alanine amidase